MEYDHERMEGKTILDILNEDCWRAVLDLLHIEDIISSERVSQQWQYVVYQYLQGARFTIEYPWYRHKTHCNFRILTMDQDDPIKFERITRKWGPCIKTADCINKHSLKVIRRNCTNLEDITFYGLQNNELLSDSSNNFEKLKRVHFRSCQVSDKCINRWLAIDTVEELAISDNDCVSGSCLTSPLSEKLKTLSLTECEALDYRHLLDASEHLKGLTKLQLKYIPKDIFRNVHMLLAKIDNLEDLCLVWQKKMEIGNELMECVCRLKHLRRLDLSFNPNVSNEWLQMLAGCKVEELHLEGCLGVSADGVTAACRAAASTLRVLNISSNYAIYDRHVESIVAACPRLVWLDVRYCSRLSQHLCGVLGAGGAGAGRAARLRVVLDAAMLAPACRHVGADVLREIADVTQAHKERYPWLTLDITEV